MKHNRLLAGILAAGSLLAIGTAAQAVPAVVATGPAFAVGPGVIVQAAPPAPLREVVPAPREGYTWSPGHYEYRNGQYAWVRGYWVAERPGYQWESAHWAQRPDGSWILVEGRWTQGSYASNDWRERREAWREREERREAWREREERREAWRARRYGPEGDMDRDGVANYNDWDRDGDGVPNRYDRYPNDPGRS